MTSLTTRPQAPGSLESLEPRLREYCEAFDLEGTVGQTARLTLGRGTSLWVSRGGLVAYSDGVDWQLRIPGSAGQALSRMFAGEGLALTHVTARSPRAQVVLGANKPGKLAAWDLRQGAIVCTRGSFVAGIGDVSIEATIARSAGAALFGGAGFFLQRLSGTGVALVHGAGDFIERQLDPGERLMVSTGHLAVFSSSVQYDVRGVGGCRRMLFGGEGLFMTELTGPGWVMLQSLKEQQLRPRTPQR